MHSAVKPNTRNGKTLHHEQTCTQMISVALRASFTPNRTNADAHETRGSEPPTCTNDLLHYKVLYNYMNNMNEFFMIWSGIFNKLDLCHVKKKSDLLKTNAYANIKNCVTRHKQLWSYRNAIQSEYLHITKEKKSVMCFIN